MSKKQRILVVDDTPSNIKILNDLLKHDYHVNVATNGSDALEIAKSDHKPDLILLDIMMPEMDGYQVCGELKSNSHTSDILIIFVSAKREIEDESKGFELGGVDYITRPISAPILQARIKTHLALKEVFDTLNLQNKELKEAAKFREDVESIMRHDLKNPLTGVFSGVDLLYFIGGLTPDQTEAADIIKEAAHRLLRMINSSLDLYKMEHELYKVDLIDVDLLEVFKEIEIEFSSLLEIHKVQIEVEGLFKKRNNMTFLVKGEVLLIYSMLSNLIKNAIEASPEHELIVVTLSKKESATLISIHNIGNIPSEIHDSFFDKFVTKGKTHGTGIGTYSAKLIVQTLGGQIRMTSSKEKGTELFVTIPD